VNKEDRVFTLYNRREADRTLVRLHCDKNWRIEITGSESLYSLLFIYTE
jgi:hypothetical protein